MLKRTTYQAQIKMDQQGFSLLTNADIAKAIAARLTGTQLRLWLYLTLTDTYADKTSSGEQIFHDLPDPATIAAHIGANRRTVERDIDVLQQMNLYSYRIIGLQGYNLTHEHARAESKRLKELKTEKRLKPAPSESAYLIPNGIKLSNSGLFDPELDNLIQKHNKDHARAQTFSDKDQIHTEAPPEPGALPTQESVCRNDMEGNSQTKTTLEPAASLENQESIVYESKDMDKDEFSAQIPIQIQIIGSDNGSQTFEVRSSSVKPEDSSLVEVRITGGSGGEGKGGEGKGGTGGSVEPVNGSLIQARVSGGNGGEGKGGNGEGGNGGSVNPTNTGVIEARVSGGNGGSGKGGEGKGGTGGSVEGRKNSKSVVYDWQESPGSRRVKPEFLLYKAGLLVQTVKVSETESLAYAQNWCNKYPDEAQLLYQGWQQQRKTEFEQQSKPKKSIYQQQIEEAEEAARNEREAKYLALGKEGVDRLKQEAFRKLSDALTANKQRRRGLC